MSGTRKLKITCWLVWKKKNIFITTKLLILITPSLNRHRPSGPIPPGCCLTVAPDCGARLWRLTVGAAAAWTACLILSLRLSLFGLSGKTQLLSLLSSLIRCCPCMLCLVCHDSCRVPFFLALCLWSEDIYFLLCVHDNIISFTIFIA